MNHLTYTKGSQSQLIIDSFSAHENFAFWNFAHANDVDVIGRCTSKIQPLDVSLNKPFKAFVREKWNEYVDSLVNASANLTPQDKLKTADKSKLVSWINDGLVYLQEHKTIVKMSFLICGITRDLIGSENHFIRCGKELAGLQLLYFQDDDNPFLHNTSDEEESNKEVEESEDEDDDGEVKSSNTDIIEVYV
uniref:DDE-1 domain-containing protein n=1 Tax=Amphimedon queenslandica TaxID=400682 RepID=A0A1X7VJV3_AMPQE